MAHEVETMMYAGETPWHGLGTYVGDEPVPVEDALVLSGLDWTVAKQPLMAGNYPIPDKVGIFRDSDNAYLGVVGSDYGIVQNKDAFAFLDDLVEEGVRVDTAGSLRGGRVIFILARFGDSYEVVNGDEIVPYMTCITSHDGSLALSAFPTSVRVVCMNTARMALANQGKAGVKITHTSQVDSRLKAAQKALKAAIVQRETFKVFSQRAANLRVDDVAAQSFFESLVPSSKEEPSTLVLNQREALFTLFQEGIGQDIPGVEGTGWALFNAVTEWVNYTRKTRGGDPLLKGQDKRFESAILGSGDAVIQRAAVMIQDLYGP